MLAGFWQELADRGQQAAQVEAQRRLNTQGQTAHIAAQNEVGDEFAQTLAAYHAGRITNPTAQAQITQAAAAFMAYATALGYQRAQNGARDIKALSVQILTDLKREAATGNTGALTGGAGGIGTLGLVAGAALVGFLIMKRK